MMSSVTKVFSIIFSAINNLLPKQRIFLGIGTVLVIYILWHNFLWNSLKESKVDIATKISTVEKEINLLKAMLEKQKQEIAYRQKISTYDSGSESIMADVPNFQHIEKYVMSADEIRTALTSVLNTKKSLNLLLELHNLSEKKISDPVDTNIFIYQNDFAIKFRGDYFSTIEYLKYLEQLPWPLFLDAMDYTVIKYPIAEIKLQLHLLSKQGGLLRV